MTSRGDIANRGFVLYGGREGSGLDFCKGILFFMSALGGTYLEGPDISFSGFVLGVGGRGVGMTGREEEKIFDGSRPFGGRSRRSRAYVLFGLGRVGCGRLGEGSRLFDPEGVRRGVVRIILGRFFFDLGRFGPVWTGVHRGLLRGFLRTGRSALGGPYLEGPGSLLFRFISPGVGWTGEFLY